MDQDFETEAGEEAAVEGDQVLYCEVVKGRNDVLDGVFGGFDAEV